MGRPPRQDPEGCTHHVVNRGVDHAPIFFADVDRVDFGRLIGVGHERYGIRIHAYCLMTNHFHLLVECPTGGLSAFMHDLTATHTRHVNDRVGRDGPLFRGRFKNLLVDSDAYLVNSARYIHRNPLDIAGVSAVDTYRWSSHRTYLGHRRRPPWLVTERVLSAFGDDVEQFHEFVVADDDELATLRPDDRVDAAQITGLIELMIDSTIDPSPRETAPLVRAVTVLASEHLGPSAGAFAGIVPADADAYRKALARARQRASDDHRIDEIVQRIARLAS